MIAELGHFSLILALCMAVVLGMLPIIGASRSISGWISVARPAAFGQLLFMVVSYGCLTYGFLTHDFSVAYVARNSNTALPVLYLISGVWGAHEGSLLLWALVLSCWTGLVALFSRTIPEATVARVLGVMGLVSIGFILFLLLTSNPFERLFPAPIGRTRLKSVASGSRLGDTSADALYGLCRLFCGVRFCDCRIARRPSGCGLGALVKTLDQHRLDVFNHRHCLGQLVGLLRTGLGRLVVLGSGRKCFIHALAGRHRVDSFVGRHRKTRRIQDLDGIAGDFCFFVKPARYISGSFRRINLGTCVCQRSRQEACSSWYFWPLW